MATFFGEDLWQEVRRRAEAAGRKLVAVPYYSSDNLVSCGQGDTLIVNATDLCISGGQTSAAVLVQAAKRGAIVLSHANLHAKILLFDDCALVSSANLSVNSTVLREAGALFQSAAELAEIRAYLYLLALEATKLDAAELRRLSLLPVSRNHGRVAHKPSLLDALQSGLPVLNEVTFGVAGRGHDLRKSDVAATADERDMTLPKGWIWFESSYARGVLGRLEAACVGRPLVSFEVRYRNGLLKEFLDLEDEARPFLHAFRVDDIVVSLFGPPWRATPVDLAAPSDELITSLNRGLAKAKSSLLRRISNEEGVISTDDMRSLFTLGKP